MEKKKSIWHKFIYSQKVAPYVFVLPFIISFILWWIYPMISTVTMSFQDIKPTGAEWVGLKNYSKLLKDTVFHQAIFNSTMYMILTLVLLIPFTLIPITLFLSKLNKNYPNIDIYYASMLLVYGVSVKAVQSFSFF